MKARLIDRSQKQFQVRELANRQMALVEQNKELKEENDRWVVMLVFLFSSSFFVYFLFVRGGQFHEVKFPQNSKSRRS